MNSSCTVHLHYANYSWLSMDGQWLSPLYIYANGWYNNVSSPNHECTSDYGHEGSFCCERQLAVCNCITYQYCTHKKSL